jgi:hypothetical protein
MRSDLTLSEPPSTTDAGPLIRSPLPGDAADWAQAGAVAIAESPAASREHRSEARCMVACLQNLERTALCQYR